MERKKKQKRIQVSWDFQKKKKEDPWIDRVYRALACQEAFVQKERHAVTWAIPCKREEKEEKKSATLIPDREHILYLGINKT